MLIRTNLVTDAAKMLRYGGYKAEHQMADELIAEFDRINAEIKRLRKLLTKAHQYLPAGILRYDVETERPWRDDHKL